MKKEVLFSNKKDSTYKVMLDTYGSYIGYQDAVIGANGQLGSISNNSLVFNGTSYLIRGLFGSQDYPYSVFVLDKVAPLPIIVKRVDTNLTITFDAIYVNQASYGYVMYRSTTSSDQLFAYSERGKTVEVLIN